MLLVSQGFLSLLSLVDFIIFLSVWIVIAGRSFELGRLVSEVLASSRIWWNLRVM